MQFLTTKLVNKDLVIHAIKIMPKKIKIYLADAFDRISKGTLKRFRKQRLYGPPGVWGASGHGLYGTFLRAFLIPREGLESMGFTIWTYSRVARTHEFGALVRDPGGGRLAVPLSAREDMFIQTRTSRRLRKRFKDPRRIKNLRPMTFKGRMFLAEEDESTGKVTPRYALKKQVRLGPRLELYITWMRLSDYRVTIINAKLDQAFREL